MSKGLRVEKLGDRAVVYKDDRIITAVAYDEQVIPALQRVIAAIGEHYEAEAAEKSAAE